MKITRRSVLKGAGAGLGTAFGGGATDALFGAGAGNVLTKLTNCRWVEYSNSPR